MISSRATEKWKVPHLMGQVGIVIDTYEYKSGDIQVKVEWTSVSDAGWHPDLTLEIVSQLNGVVDERFE